MLSDLELRMSSVAGTAQLDIQPKVVDAGHHHRKLMRLTGMDVGEKQAQRLLNDIDTYRMVSGKENLSLEMVAHDWVNAMFEPLIEAIPPQLASKLEQAQIYHEFLEHRWFLGEQSGHDIPYDEAVRSYIDTVLSTKRDEAVFIEPDSDVPTPSSNPDLW